jgi:hypothetical protein
MYVANRNCNGLASRHMDGAPGISEGINIRNCGFTQPIGSTPSTWTMEVWTKFVFSIAGSKGSTRESWTSQPQEAASEQVKMARAARLLLWLMTFGMT